MRIKTVLCPVDFTPLSERHLQLAVSICRRFGARLVIEHNVGASPPFFMGVTWMWSGENELPDQAEMADAGEHLRKLLDSLPGEVNPTGKLSRGPLDISLLAAAETVGADLIVIGSRGWGGVDHHSATEELIARAPCPVFGVNERSVETDFFDPARPAPDHAARILVPIGSSPDDLGAVDHAVELGRAFGMHLTFVSITPRHNAAATGAALERTARREEDLERRIREMVPEMAPQFTCIAVPGKPGCEIIRIATEIAADLIVMEGHHGGLFRHLFSPPTSCEVLHESPCPVWYVPVPLAVAAGSEGARMERAG